MCFTIQQKSHSKYATYNTKNEEVSNMDVW